MSEPDRQRFETEYRAWLVSVARDAARNLADMPVAKREMSVKCYRQLQEPSVVFRNISDPERFLRVSDDRISKYILVETEAVTFFPSIQTPVPGAMDFAVAMNRRFFFRDLWFPIIALNSEYIRRSSDKLLGFTLEHEFEMSRIYQQISEDYRVLSGKEKNEVANQAQDFSVQKKQITKDELVEDEKLMIQLSKTRPLIPKPYAETALLLFLEFNFSDLQSFGVPSKSDEEQSFGTELYDEFSGWADFSISTYILFVRELLFCLNEAYQGYV